MKTIVRLRTLFSRANRNLLSELIRANFKVVDYNSLLGISWSFIGPAALLLTLYLVFSKNFGVNIPAYPLYLLIGIVCVNFFITVTSCMTGILLSNREIILNSTIPEEILLISNLYVHIHKFMIELSACLILSALYGFFSWRTIILLIPILVSYVAFVFSVGFMLSLGFCFARDVHHLWMLISRLIFFATPVFYRLDAISPWAGKIAYWLNPITCFLISFRNVFMPDGKFNAAVYIYSVILGVCLFIFGYSVFIVFNKAAVEHI